MASSHSVSYIERGLSSERPHLSNEGLRLLNAEDCPCQAGPPRAFSECSAAAFGDAADPRFSDPGEIIAELHANGAHVSAQRVGRILVDSDGYARGLIDAAGEVIQQREVCRAFDTPSHVPIAGASTASPLYDEILAHLLFLAGAIALCAMDMYS